MSSGILLYVHYYSFYVQRLLIGINEKQLSFDEKEVDLLNNEQYSPWFLNINPKGEVPVLQHGNKIVPDSSAILDYLEENFVGNDIRKLMPDDEGVRDEINFWRKEIDKIPANTVTMGCCFHDDLISSPRMPFLGPIRSAMRDGDAKKADQLRELADKYPEHRAVLMAKVELQEKNHLLASDRGAFLKLLSQVNETLQRIEDQLASEKEGEWLVNNDFNLADVNLATLLERLSQIGLAARLWEHSKPNVTSYYKRMWERDSVRRSFPTMWTHIRILVGMKAIIGGAVTVAASTAALGLYFIFRRRSNN